MNQNIATQRINDYLQRNGITREDLSQKTGIPQREINSMLAGRSPIGTASVEKFCIALGTDPNNLLMNPTELKEVETKAIIAQEITGITAGLSLKNLQRLLWFARGLMKNDHRQLTKEVKASALSKGV